MQPTRFLFLKVVCWILFTFALGLLILSVLAPVTETEKLGISPHFYGFLRNFCHQVPSRCLWYQNSNFGLCSHCSGLWLGVAFWGILFGADRVQRFVLKQTWKRVILASILSLTPIFLDILIGLGRDQINDHLIRIITGFLAAGGAWLLAGFSLHKWAYKLELKREVR